MRSKQLEKTCYGMVTCARRNWNFPGYVPDPCKIPCDEVIETFLNSKVG